MADDNLYLLSLGAANALVILGRADPCPRSPPTESQAGHGAATGGLVTPDCILRAELKGARRSHAPGLRLPPGLSL